MLGGAALFSGFALATAFPMFDGQLEQVLDPLLGKLAELCFFASYRRGGGDRGCLLACKVDGVRGRGFGPRGDDLEFALRSLRDASDHFVEVLFGALTAD